MSSTRTSGTHRTLAAVLILVVGLGSVLFGLAGGASAADSNRVPEAICHPVGSANGGNTGAGYNLESPDASGIHLENGVPKHSFGGRVDTLLGADLLCPGEADTQTETRSVVGAPDCEAGTVTTSHQERTRTEIAYGVWGEWSAWTETSTSSRPATEQECPPYVLKTDTETRSIDGSPDCETDSVPVYDQERTRTETAEGSWGEWSDWVTVSTGSREATDTECPPYVLKTDTDEQTIDGTPDCETDTVPVYDQERTRTETAEGSWGEWSDWVTVSTGSREATDTECPPYVLKTDTDEQTIDGTPDCETDTVPVYDQERTRTETAEGSWGEWSDWVTVSTGSREATDTECPPYVLKTDTDEQTIDGTPDCETDTVPVYDQERTRTETAEGSWGEWSDWVTVSTGSREATDTECPPEVLNDEVEYQDAEGDPDCDTDTVPLWTEKRVRPADATVWGAWVKVEGSDSTRAATDQECPDPSTPTTPGTPTVKDTEGSSPKSNEPEVLGIEKDAPAPAAVPTAVAAGYGDHTSGDSSTLWVLLGAALALAGLAVGFGPATARGKRSV